MSLFPACQRRGQLGRFRITGLELSHEGFGFLDAGERHADVAVAQSRHELVIEDGPHPELAFGYSFRSLSQAQKLKPQVEVTKTYIAYRGPERRRPSPKIKYTGPKRRGPARVRSEKTVQAFEGYIEALTDPETYKVELEHALAVETILKNQAFDDGLDAAADMVGEKFSLEPAAKEIVGAIRALKNDNPAKSLLEGPP